MTREEWKELSPEEQRIKVAELCGWIRRAPDSNGLIWWEHRVHGRYKPISLRPPYSLSDVPDYLNDLNAMHEAEKCIPHNIDDDYAMYREYTRRLRCNTSGWVFNATAAQRAEEFVLTMEAK